MIGNAKKKEYLEDKKFYLECIEFWYQSSLCSKVGLQKECKELAERFMGDLKNKTQNYERNQK